jgi:AraC family transcriptional regulator, arabinose operon regulatory protein
VDARVKVTISRMRQFLSQQLSVNMQAKNVNLSSSRLRQLFKKETGLSPVQYLRSLRMQKAEELIRDSFLSIKEVAAMSGIRDVSHFVRDFKKTRGLSPSALRAGNQLFDKLVQTDQVPKRPTNRRFR